MFLVAKIAWMIYLLPFNWVTLRGRRWERTNQKNQKQSYFEPFHETIYYSSIPEHLPEDDSDMLMEPDEFHGQAVLQQRYFPSTEYQQEFIPAEHTVQPHIVPGDAQTQAAQNFLPSLFRNSPPLGHSRPYYQAPEQQNTHSRFTSGRSIQDQSILGSGDFGVIRGGTFYQANDPPARSVHALDSNDYLSFFNNNGHGRPHTAPYTKNLYSDDQFANFRDFADINTPTDPAYSQFVVVYANKNSTAPHPNPKNIFEQLQLLDRDGEHKKNSISKFKKKLANTKLEKKYKKKLGPKEKMGDFEPLLALS